MYKIFIAEDDERIASILSSHLHKYGYEVSMAEAFDRIKQEFLEKTPIWFYWILISHILTAFIGADKSAPFQMCRSFSFQPGRMN